MAGGRRTQDINVPLLLTIGVIGTILLVTIVIGIEAWFRWEVIQEEQVKVINVSNQELDQLTQSQLANLTGGRWTAGQTRGSMPIDDAMNTVVEMYSQASPQAPSPASPAQTQPAHH